jgi:class 3 adenylate cyclase/YHS domain-containing protein
VTIDGVTAANSLSAMREQTFVFADLSGFTALTEAHGDRKSADVASEFIASVRDLVSLHNAEEVKTIGDAVMVRTSEADVAVRLGLEIIHFVHGRARFPTAHVGMNTGRAVNRDSDWFGASVNIAARVAGAAAGDEVLVTRATVDSVGDISGVEFHSRGEVRLRNIAEPVHVYRAFPTGSGSGEVPIDPVCRMMIETGHAAGWLVHDGQKYWLCSRRCMAKFAGDPDAIVRALGG